jgi:hypothetical protein
MSKNHEGTPARAGATSSAPFVCADEASALLNCIAGKNYDKEKCAKYIESLRNCCIKKVGGGALFPRVLAKNHH